MLTISISPACYISYIDNRFRLSSTFALGCLLLLHSHSLQADEHIRIAEFRVIDQQYLTIAREKINNRCRDSFGTFFRTNKKHDLPLLQRLLDEKRVTAEELDLLQAMGIILGDILSREYPLDWVRYIDQYGSSRALKLRHQEHYLFPITAISRRASVGASVDITAIYQKLRNPVVTAYNR